MQAGRLDKRVTFQSKPIVRLCRVTHSAVRISDGLTASRCGVRVEPLTGP